MMPAPGVHRYQAPREGRHLFRYCLAVLAIDGHPSTDPPCPMCGREGDGYHKALMLMGRVEGRSVVATQGYCPCDERCTTARGPSCSCACGGRNHGIGLLYQTVQVGDTVKLEALDVRSRRGAEKYRLAGETWRRLRAEYHSAIEERFGRIMDAKSRGEWVSDADFRRLLDLRDFQQERQGISAMTGPSRNRKLEDLIARVREGGAP